jgi:NADH-quinone oxidoreductase subunit N
MFPDLNKLQSELGTSLFAFTPELIVCGTIVLLLVLRLFRGLDHLHLAGAAMILTVTALSAAIHQWYYPPDKAGYFFSGLLAYDRFMIAVRLFLLAFAVLVIWLTVLTGIPDREDSADFYSLLLGATLGMMLMSSANHLLMIFIAVEMASVPSYALAGFLKGKRQGSEASLKYVVYGGGASGIMLYGISLLAGKFGTGYLPDVAAGFAAVLGAVPQSGALVVDPVLMLGTLFILIGISFKLAAVPFHFWCPDVFEGAAAEVAGFLSVASKGAALALLARFSLVLAGQSTAREVMEAVLNPAGGPIGGDPRALARVAQYFIPAIAILAAVTATFGNLAAYSQMNLKRLLAYSTIAHAGYMMMGLATLTADGVSAVLFYLVPYLLMNLGAFAVIAFLRNLTGSENLESFRGLIYRAPLLVVAFAFFIFSLVGVPPLAGFAAKFQIFAALFNAADFYTQSPALRSTMYALVAIGLVNTVISLVYYVKVLKVMILDKPVAELNGEPAPVLQVPIGPAIYSCVFAALTLVVGLAWDPLAQASNESAAGTFRKAEKSKGAFEGGLSQQKKGPGGQGKGKGQGQAKGGKGKEGKGKGGGKAKEKGGKTPDGKTTEK